MHILSILHVAKSSDHFTSQRNDSVSAFTREHRWSNIDQRSLGKTVRRKKELVCKLLYFCCFQILAGILHLGNVTFSSSGEEHQLCQLPEEAEGMFDSLSISW